MEPIECKSNLEIKKYIEGKHDHAIFPFFEEKSSSSFLC